MKIYRMKAELDKYVTFLYSIENENYSREFDEIICSGSLISGKYDSIELEVELEKMRADRLQIAPTYGILQVHIFSVKEQKML